MTKPFHFDEVVARLRALLRRSGADAAAKVGTLRLDPLVHAVVASDREVSLTPTEFRVLAALAAQPGAVVRRRELVRAAWPEGAIVHDNTLDQYVARLRRKLRELGSEADGRTAHGVGYRLRHEPFPHAARQAHRAGHARRARRPRRAHLAFDLVLEASVDRDANSRLRAQAAAAARDGRFRDGRLACARRRATPSLDRQVWVYQGTRAVERPQTSARLQRAAARSPAGARVRRRAATTCASPRSPVSSAAASVGTLVAGQSLAAIDRTTDIAQIASVVLSAVLLAAVFILTRISVGRALRPGARR